MDKRDIQGRAMGRPAYNDRGVEHVHNDGPEATEYKKLCDEMVAHNTASGKDRDMRVFNPAESQAQARAMYAAAEGHSTLGIPAKVGKEFTKGFAGKTGSVKRLPARKK